jgi:hypothetical protein
MFKFWLNLDRGRIKANLMQVCVDAARAAALPVGPLVVMEIKLGDHVGRRTYQPQVTTHLSHDVVRSRTWNHHGLIDALHGYVMSSKNSGLRCLMPGKCSTDRPLHPLATLSRVSTSHTELNESSAYIAV